MKRAVAYLTAAFLLSALPLRQLSAQNADYSRLDSLLTRFYESMDYLDIDAKCAEMDRLVESATDSLLRQHIAISIFEHYKEPPLMGDEAIAVHFFDKWFDSALVPMRSEYETIDARIFADFNRATLIGETAPVIEMSKPCGGKFSFPRRGHSSLLFFFDTACAKCKLELKLLPQLLSKMDSELDLYMIYAGSDKKAWKRFRSDFSVANPKIHLFHGWDPEYESDYLRLYGVISTPKMYLIEPEGTVIGRRLEVENLVELLPVVSAIQATYDKYYNN